MSVGPREILRSPDAGWKTRIRPLIAIRSQPRLPDDPRRGVFSSHVEADPCRGTFCRRTLGNQKGLAYALHLDARGFTKSDIGQLAAFFASGIVAMSIPVGMLLRRFSAKMTLATSLVGYAIAVGTFPLLHTYGALALARFFDGAFSVGIWVSCETILLMRSDQDNKAYVTSIYAVAIAIGYIAGPLAARPIAHAFSVEASFWVAAGRLRPVGSRRHRAPRRRPARRTSTTVARLSERHAGTGDAAGRANPDFVLPPRLHTDTSKLPSFCFCPFTSLNRKGSPASRRSSSPAFFAAGMLLP